LGDRRSARTIVTADAAPPAFNTAAEPVGPDAWSVRLPLDVPYPPYTLTYLLVDSDRGVHVVDPGINRESNLTILLSALEQIGLGPAHLRSVTSTHLHRDHTGLGLRLRELYGVPMAIHVSEQSTLDAWAAKSQRPLDFTDWGVPEDVARGLAELPVGDRRVSFTADRLLADGEYLGIPGFALRVLHTPGHTTGHITLWDEPRNMLFTGDHLLPHIYPGIGLGGAAVDPIGDYLRSLKMLDAVGDPLVLPGHGHVFEGLRARVEATQSHQQRRTEEVAELLRDDPAASVWEIASGLTWTDGWDGLSPRNRAHALRQTAMRIVLLGGTPGRRRQA
jgi:glyoxylase-like metal-dependent hydrolase (beta-lactamase superfamily II)